MTETVNQCEELESTGGNLPKGWRMVQFGDVVRDVKESERNPLEVGLERYIGLEHIEPENLHIKEWGDLIQGEVSFTKRFRKGQVLFAKRRAYQRKVGLVDFDGICSSDILTFEPKDDSLIPELLPFIVQSDAFFDHALYTSSGSLSPRTRWSQLKDFEFPLPSKTDQERIAMLLRAAEQLIQRSLKVVEMAGIARRRFVANWLENLKPSETRLLSKLWTESPGSGYSPSPSSQDTGHYVLILSSLSKDGYIPGHLKPVEVDERVRATVVEPGDLLVSRSNTTELVGLAGVFDEQRSDVSFPDLMMRVRVDESIILTKYLELVMLSPQGRRHMRRVAAGTSGSMKKINRKGLGALEIPLPSIDGQHQLLGQVANFDRAIRGARIKLRNEQVLLKSMCRHLLYRDGKSGNVVQ